MTASPIEGLSDAAALPRQRPRAGAGLRVELLEALLSVVADGYVFTRHGRIQEVNAAMTELTGYSRSELEGHPEPYPFWPSQQLESSTALAQAIRAAGGVRDLDVEFSHRDGHQVAVSITTQPVLRPTGEVLGFVTLVRDQTEARRQRLEVAETQRMLAEAQNQAHLGSWLLDFQGDADAVASHPRGRLAWSLEMFRIYGVNPAAGAPTPEQFVQIMHPEDLQSYLVTYNRALRLGGRHTVDHRIVLPDGRVRHIHGTAEVELDPTTGLPLIARGGAQDVTEQVRREQALAASEEQMRLIVSASPIGLSVLGLDGTLREANAALCRILGRDRDELLGSVLWNLGNPDDFRAHHQARQEVAAGERDSYEAEGRYRHQDGHWVWVSLHVALLRDALGTPLQLIVQVADITDRRTHQALLRRESRTDPLTSLANRRAWEENLLAVLDVARIGGQPYYIAIVDLDHFKIFNDTFGHPAGDQLLRETTAAWTSYLDSVPGAFLARIGGEEFALSIPGIGAEDARATLSTLLTLVPRGQSASAGLTRTLPSDEGSTAMTRADAALYAAKRAGRNQLQLLNAG